MSQTLIDLEDDLALAHADLRNKSYRADHSVWRKVGNCQRWRAFMIRYGPQIDDILGMPVGWAYQPTAATVKEYDFTAVERWARLAAVAVEVMEARERARTAGSHTKSAAKT